jgi:hypothetical protein
MQVFRRGLLINPIKPSATAIESIDLTGCRSGRRHGRAQIR